MNHRAVWTPCLIVCALGLLGASWLSPRFPALAAQADAPLIQLSSDGTHLVRRDGRPTFINGEAAWSLMAAVTMEDAEAYLQERQSRGFNAVLVNLLEHKFSPHPPANAYGVSPFQQPGRFDLPDAAYFDHADEVLRRAEAHGLTVLLAPLYLGNDCSDEGWCREVQASSVEAIESYGRYIGRRFGNAANVIWVIGGDTDPFFPYRPKGPFDRLTQAFRGWWNRDAQGVGAKLRAFVRGMRQAGARQLATAHNRSEQLASDPWPSEDWLDLDNVYTYEDTYLPALLAYNSPPSKPFFLIETTYENEHGATPLLLRRQAYWSVLSGGVLGHVFGNCEIWGFSYGFCKDSWKAQLDSPGSRTLPLVGRLFTSRPFYALVPDQNHEVLTEGYGEGDEYAAAARAADGSTVIVYIPTKRTVTLDMSKISGRTARAWWFDPRSAKVTEIGTFPTTGERQFDPPDSQDWVLVVDDAAADFQAPGVPATSMTGG